MAIFRQFARALGTEGGPGVVVEWGCGGGANAVVFAPAAKKFIAADVSAESVAECVRQIEAVCDTPIESVIIDIEHPEYSVTGMEESCDTFICLYVLELTAGRKEALRVLDIAERMLISGGIAFIQVKYHNADWRTRGYRRNYRRNLGSMTTFAIDEFWLRSSEFGLTPQLITLVPKNQLDSHYAYYALVKP